MSTVDGSIHEIFTTVRVVRAYGDRIPPSIVMDYFTRRHPIRSQQRFTSLPVQTSINALLDYKLYFQICFANKFYEDSNPPDS